MATPDQILEDALQRARELANQPVVTDKGILERIEFVARCLSNRAGVRMLITCALAKIHRPEVDIRKPYTEIGDSDAYSGRGEYDEKYVASFTSKYQLPVNATTAFLTPGFRTINVPLAPPLKISGTPKKMYEGVIQLLDDVYRGNLSAMDLLVETLRQLLVIQQEQASRITQLLNELRTTQNSVPLSSEETVNLIQQHLRSPKSSRLPVLVIAAAYLAASDKIGERVKRLYAHNAADLQTGAIGDIEITLADDDNVVTSYEMKAKDVTKADVDLAVQKVALSGRHIDNYIFITTGAIDKDVSEYATSLYRETGGIEFAILDCIGFLRHFLHFFHRLRLDFLEQYQNLILSEPESAVNQPLKEVFLALRRAAEIDSSA